MITYKTWRKSSYTGAANNCVELAHSLDTTAIRDSKNVPGPMLAFRFSSVRNFVDSIKSDQVKH